jgi:hypothetical protein
VPKNYEDINKRFGFWLLQVDKEMEAEFGMVSDDGEDWDWWDAFEAGNSPRLALIRYMKYCGFEG